MKRLAHAIYAALLALASIVGMLAPVQAQAQTTKYYCSGGSSGSYPNGGSYTGCPTSTNPAASPGKACSMITAAGTVSGYQPWIQAGYSSGYCQFRAYLLADVSHKCYGSCLSYALAFSTVPYSSAQTIHVFAVFTAAAKTYIEGTGSSESAFFAAELAKLTAANTASFTQITWVNSGFSSGASGLCCGAATTLAGALTSVQTNNDVLVARDNSGGDITIIYGKYAGDAPYNASYANTPAAAFAGVNVDQVGPVAPFYVDPASTAAAVGTMMGAGTTGANAYAYKGGTPTACNVWWTIGTSTDNNVPTGATVSKWFFGYAGETAAPGSNLQLGPFPDGDFGDANSLCMAVPVTTIGSPPAGWGAWQNKGYSASNCQFRAYMDADTGQACSPSCRSATAPPATHLVPDGTTFACTSVSTTGGWSTPDHNLGGVPKGDGNSYGASTVNFNAAGVSVFHSTQIGIH